MVKSTYLLILAGASISTAFVVPPSTIKKTTTDHQVLNFCENENFSLERISEKARQLSNKKNDFNHNKKFTLTSVLALNSLAFLTPFYSVANAVAKDVAPAETNGIMEAIIPAIGGCFAVSFVVAFALEFMSIEDDEETETSPHLLPLAESFEKETKSIAKEVQKPSAQTLEVPSKRMPFDSSAAKTTVPTRDSKPATGKKRSPMKLDASQSVFTPYLDIVNRAMSLSTPEPLERVSEVTSETEETETVAFVEPVVNRRMPFDSSATKAKVPSKDSKPTDKKKAPVKLDASQSVFASYLNIVNRAMSLTVSKPLERVSEVTSETEETETVAPVEPVVNRRMPFDSSAVKAKVPSKDSKPTDKKKIPVKLDASQSVFASYLEVVNRAPKITERKPLVERQENVLPVEPVVEKPTVSISSKKKSSIPMKDSKPAAGKKKAPAKLNASNSVFASYLDIVNRAMSLSKTKPLKRVEPVVNRRMPFDSSAIKAKVPSKDSKQDAGKQKAPVKLDASQSVFASYLEVVNRAPTFTERKPLEILSEDTSEIEESENVLPVEPVVEKPAISISSKKKSSIPMKDSKPAAGKKKAPAKLDASNSVFASYLDIVNRAPKPVNKAMPFSFAKSDKGVKESEDLLSNLSNHTSATGMNNNNTSSDGAHMELLDTTTTVVEPFDKASPETMEKVKAVTDIIQDHLDNLSGDSEGKRP